MLGSDLTTSTMTDRTMESAEDSMYGSMRSPPPHHHHLASALDPAFGEKVRQAATLTADSQRKEGVVNRGRYRLDERVSLSLLKSIHSTAGGWTANSQCIGKRGEGTIVWAFSYTFQNHLR